MQSRRGRPRKHPVTDALVERGMDRILSVDELDRLLDGMKLLYRVAKREMRWSNMRLEHNRRDAA